MILTSHQPDLLPWTGFWHKLWRADLMDLAIYDQFQSRGYQRRVTMRGKWASLKIGKWPVNTRIDQVRLGEGAADQLKNDIRGRYRDARYWWSRGDMVIDWIDSASGDDWRVVDSGGQLLWQFNLALILQVKEYLGISTPIAIGSPLVTTGINGVIEMVDGYEFDPDTPGVTYLSGGGGRSYLGDDPEAEFRRRGHRLIWSNHSPVSGDSILTAIFDYERPMDVVEATEVPDERLA